MTISSAIQKSGCADSEGSKANYLPKMLFSLEENENQSRKSWYLRLLGAGEEPLDLFRCNLYEGE